MMYVVGNGDLIELYVVDKMFRLAKQTSSTTYSSTTLLVPPCATTKTIIITVAALSPVSVFR